MAKKDFRKEIKWLWERKLYLILGLIFLFFFMLFGGRVKAILVVGGLVILASISTVYKRYLRMPPAFELMTFGTVIVSLAYGPVIGAIFGFVTSITSEIVNGSIDIFVVSYAPARAVVGIVTPYFMGMDIFALGMLMTALYNIIGQPMYFFMGDVEAKGKLAFFLVGNFLVNAILFNSFGRLILPFLLPSVI